jgi:hypothetical protein
MTPRDAEEYSALRATIRERGTARISIFVAGLAAWSALTTAVAALSSTPLSVVLPLTLLAAVFEAVLALHIGVERIGRYLQVAHEDGWEDAAMQFGRPRGAIALDALFTPIFFIATLVNLAPALILDPTRAELAFAGGAHILFVLRLLTARAAAGRQRAIDLARFRELRGVPPHRDAR